MASSRLTKAAYEAAKKAAALDNVSAVEWISRAVFQAAQDRITREVAEVEARGVEADIAEVRTRHAAQLAELMSFIEPKPEEPNKKTTKMKPKGKADPKAGD